MISLSGRQEIIARRAQSSGRDSARQNSSADCGSGQEDILQGLHFVQFGARHPACGSTGCVVC